MKKLQLTFILFTGLLLLLSSAKEVKGQPIKTDINTVLSEPESYLDEYIQVKGKVSQYLEDNSATTDNYLFIGEYGNPIIVQTKRPLPNIDSKYKIEGTLHFNSDQNRYVISELKRTKYFNPLYLILGGAILILLILIVIVLLKPQNKSKKAVTPQPIPNKPEAPVQPKSLTLFPGKFEILSGPESGRIIKCPAYPKGNYSIITIGSSMVSPPEDVSHIMLRDRSIDNMHAELRLFDDKSIKIKNLSSGNYFTQVGDEELMPNVVGDILPGTIITLGETKIKYEL
jgi:hypothetical protein